MRRLRSRSVCAVDAGLTDREFAQVEGEFGFQFADDHRAFLAAGLPVNTKPEPREQGVIYTHPEPRRHVSMCARGSSAIAPGRPASSRAAMPASSTSISGGIEPTPDPLSWNLYASLMFMTIKPFQPGMS